ncbi:hypothetical protein B0T21DRAFT_12010 [Apiosordaria backusii]|uniref:Uncharacterized protein n=1 Tax=Apiosordaria backusii TaxID=314023 RepID=A0AA40EYG4_9PEZI|nr:hypothetical protein B0T21DRAFT_12010 [Apiosordaria backusii]
MVVFKRQYRPAGKHSQSKYSLSVSRAIGLTCTPSLGLGRVRMICPSTSFPSSLQGLSLVWVRTIRRNQAQNAAHTPCGLTASIKMALARLVARVHSQSTRPSRDDYRYANPPFRKCSPSCPGMGHRYHQQCCAAYTVVNLPLFVESGSQGGAVPGRDLIGLLALSSSSQVTHKDRESSRLAVTVLSKQAYHRQLCWLTNTRLSFLEPVRTMTLLISLAELTDASARSHGRPA